MPVYWFSFTPNPVDSANLSPTFIQFIKYDGTTLTPPGITQVIAGTGQYQFTYTPSFAIAFTIDGATSGLNPSIRYIANSLSEASDANALLGTPSSSYGTDTVDPDTIFGYVKRLQEFLEGNQDFAKLTGEWDIYSRGSSTLLRTKSLANSVTGVTRS